MSNSEDTTLGIDAEPISKWTTPDEAFGVKQVMRVLLILSVGETAEPMRQKFNVLSKDVPKMLTRYPPSPYTMLGLKAVTTGPTWKSNTAPPSTKFDASLTSCTWHKPPKLVIGVRHEMCVEVNRSAEVCPLPSKKQPAIDEVKWSPDKVTATLAAEGPDEGIMPMTTGCSNT